jgi:RNA polymerase subunit RPABC4/transcription elongation factor Spt4
LNNLKQRVSDTAKYAAKKSNKVVEITKLNIAISSEEDKIKKVFYDLGKLAYQSFLEEKNAEETFLKKYEQIQVYEKNIEDMKSKINQLKQIKICVSCKGELEEDMNFCFVCGCKQENTEKKIVKISVETDEPDETGNQDKDKDEKKDPEL